MARREYALTTTDMPEEESIKALPVGAQWLYDRLRFRKEISRCGVLQWRPAVLAELAPDATDKKIRALAKHLEVGRQIVLDEPYAECLVRTYVRWDGLLAQPNVIPHLVYDFGLITSTKVRLGFLREFRRLWDLDGLKDAERGGWLLAVGHYPRRKHARDDPAKWPVALEEGTLARLVKEIGDGIREPLTSAIAAGDVAPFVVDSTHGAPDPFQGPHAGTPSPHPLPGPPPPTPPEEGTPSRARAGAHRLPAPATETDTGTVTDTETGGSNEPNTASVSPDPDEPAAAAADTHTQAEQLVTQQAGRLTGAVRLALTATTRQLLDEGHNPTLIATSLADWRQRPGSGAGLLPWLLNDRLNTTNGKPRNGNGHHDLRPTWCRHCDETSRAEPVNPDDPHSAYRRCPRCHPLAVTASKQPAASEPPSAHGGALAMSGPDDPPF